MQCACAILSSVVWTAIQYLPTLSLKRQDFRKKKKKVFEFKMCVLFFCKTFVWKISHSEKNWARCEQKCVHWSACKVQLFLSDFDETWLFSTYFRKNTEIWNFLKIRPVGAMLFHADLRTDGRTYMTKITRFQKFRERGLNCPKQ